MRNSPARSIRDDAGAQILEFALALPLLVVFVVAIYDFGQAFNVKEKLNFAAKDGARLGATQPTNDLTQNLPTSVTAIRDLVDSDLLAAGINDCGLGTIHQTLTTLIAAAAFEKGLVVAGIVLNQPTSASDPSTATNRAELERRAVPPVLAEVAHRARSFAPAVNWFALARSK